MRDDTSGFSDPFDLRRRLSGAPSAGAAVGATRRWCLESRFGAVRVPHRTPVQPVPFRIGRGPGVNFVLAAEHVSKLHAEIYSDGVALRVRDLGSRNGTFLNRQPVTDAPLHEGDHLRIGRYEFRLSPDPEDFLEAADTQELTREIAATRVKELIAAGAVSVAFQPIVSLQTGELVACEALGRGALGDLPQGPVELLDLAGAVGPDAQAALSRLFRRRAVELAAALDEPPLVLLNTHPADLEQPGLVDSLAELRRAFRHVPLAVELHDSALAHPVSIAWLCSELGALEVGVVFDDFGAGQARLIELAEVPPRFLKLDRRYVTGIDRAAEPRQRLVASLVSAARELRVPVLAEGVETAEEAEACRRLGFALAQGYFFGRPGPLAAAPRSAAPASDSPTPRPPADGR
jgi:EAL domain-containing protein (putative c-di-GMP-specific phosphodiesterase class I)